MPAAVRSTAPLQHWELHPAAAPSADKKQELPALRLLPPITATTFSATASSAPKSTASPSRAAFLTHSAAYCGQPKSASQSSTRPSSSPSLSATAPLPAGLYHPQRLPSTASSASSSSKPRWFTNRLALSLPAADDRIDFTRYSSHASSYAPQRKRWTRDAMIAEILAEKQKQREHLRTERLRLDRELHRVRAAPPVSADSREQLLSFLQSPRCLLFQGAESAISVRDRDLDQLITSGGEEQRRGSDGRRSRGFLLYLQQLNDSGLRCATFQILISYVKKARAEAEEQQNQKVEQAEKQQDGSTQPQDEAGEAEPAQEPAVADSPPAAAAPALGPAVVEPEKEEAAVEQQPEQAEPQPEVEAAAEAEEEKKQDEAAVLPKLTLSSAAVDSSSLLGEKLAAPSSGRMRMDSIADRGDTGAHLRHNTVAAADEASQAEGKTGEAALSVGSLMQKLAELEEEQEKDEEQPASSEQAAAQQDAEFGNAEEDAQPL